jgi:hypothetical protein
MRRLQAVRGLNRQFKADSTNRRITTSFLRQKMWREHRRSKLRSSPFPPDWQRIVETNCPFLHQLPESDRRELSGHARVFLAEKKFEGCGGLNITDEIRVTIAAHACLLLLHRHTDYYPGLMSVLVYPDAYVVPTTRHVGSGVMEESWESRAGEAWSEGAVVLSWDDVRNGIQSPENGYNVVFHEFAHLLDFEDGLADGVPVLDHGESRPVRKQHQAAWTRVLKTEFERLCGQVERGESTVLRAYGATNPAEFFAVATECFFCKPRAMQQQHAELYEELKWYYQQDPAQWLPARLTN